MVRRPTKLGKRSQLMSQSYVSTSRGINAPFTSIQRSGSTAQQILSACWSLSSNGGKRRLKECPCPQPRRHARIYHWEKDIQWYFADSCKVSIGLGLSSTRLSSSCAILSVWTSPLISLSSDSMMRRQLYLGRQTVSNFGRSGSTMSSNFLSTGDYRVEIDRTQEGIMWRKPKRNNSQFLFKKMKRPHSRRATRRCLWETKIKRTA